MTEQYAGNKSNCKLFYTSYWILIQLVSTFLEKDIEHCEVIGLKSFFELVLHNRIIELIGYRQTSNRMYIV